MRIYQQTQYQCDRYGKQKFPLCKIIEGCIYEDLPVAEWKVKGDFNNPCISSTFLASNLKTIKVHFQQNYHFITLLIQFNPFQTHGTSASTKKSPNQPTVTSLISNGRRRLVYVYEDGREMIEQYDMKTHEIVNRKIKNPATFKQSKWEWEIGDGLEKVGEDPVLVKASNAPIFVRKDVLDSYQWRVRNLPYPIQAYILEVDPNKQEIIIKTTVKKYYKRFDIPDLKRMNIKLNKDNLSHTYKNQTLVVSYKKPDEVLEKEIKLRKQFDRMNLKKPKEGDVECSTQ